MLVSEKSAPVSIAASATRSAARGENERERTHRPERAFLRGSIIVKSAPHDALRATRDARERQRGADSGPFYADFDIVAIDAAADPEAVARQLDAQPDVEYAQARYRMRPMFTPNDPMYSRQWNYPALDMERAWDINPGATSDVVVAVLDSGVAFRNGVFRYNARAFGIVGGPSFPALGAIDVPFAAAPELGGRAIRRAPQSSGTTTCRSIWTATART